MSFFLSRDPVTGASAVVLCTKASSGDLLYIGPQYTRSWDLSCFSKPLYKNTEAFYNNIGLLVIDRIWVLYSTHSAQLPMSSSALVPRYEVRPCMLALYFLGETSKVFRLVKTSKVFARKHRRCFR